MTQGAQTWLGKPLGGLTTDELEELAERLAAESADEPMLLAVRRELRERRDT